MASITAGFIWLMGILDVFNIPLNAMNIWIIPIILSIGMNNAILILLRWKQEKNLDTIYRSTGKAIFITTLTICIMGFPFWFTNYTGLTSIARILLAGLSCSFIANFIIIPTLLVQETHR